MESGLYGPNEISAAMCRIPNGRIVIGPLTEGTPDSVTVDLTCPVGSVFEGIFHTHPGIGVTRPSPQDLLTGIRSGANELCIFSDGAMECHHLR